MAILEIEGHPTRVAEHAGFHCHAPLPQVGSRALEFPSRERRLFGQDTMIEAILLGRTGRS